MQSRNICLISDSFAPTIDGVANAVMNYGTYLSRNGDSALVATPYVPGGDDEGLPFPVVRYPSLGLSGLEGYRAGYPFAAAITAQLEGCGFDLIHSHCPFTATMLARVLRDRIHVPVVFTYHTKYDVDVANTINSRLLQDSAIRWIVQNIAACDEVWTVSRGAGENLQKLGYEGEFTVMPNGVDFPRGRVDEALIRETTADYPLPEGVPVFLFVGRMMWYKGLRVILDAMAKLRGEDRDFRMVFVGGGAEKEEIVSYAASLGLTEPWVIFAEPLHDREKLRAWYCRGDLFLFPSTFDTNGLVVREAAACGLASVLIRGSCAAEGVEDGVNGFLIDQDAESLAQMLRRILAVPGSTARVGQQAARDLYLSWEQAVALARERYETVIEAYRQGRYPARNKLSDLFYHNMAKTMKLISELGLAFTDFH